MNSYPKRHTNRDTILISVRRWFRSFIPFATLHSTSKRACRRRSLSISRAAFQTSNGREIQCEKGISPVIRRCVGNRNENRFYETAGQRKNGHVETSLSIQANLYEFISDDVIRREMHEGWRSNSCPVARCLGEFETRRVAWNWKKRDAGNPVRGEEQPLSSQGLA